MRFLSFTAALATASAAMVSLSPPPTGQIGPITGHVSDVPLGSYKVEIMVSPDQVHWYEKTHGANVAVGANGGFQLAGWAYDPQGDANVQYFGAWVIPSSFDLTTFTCEDAPPPDNLVAASIASTIALRPAAGASASATPSRAASSVQPSSGATTTWTVSAAAVAAVTTTLLITAAL